MCNVCYSATFLGGPTYANIHPQPCARHMTARKSFSHKYVGLKEDLDLHTVFKVCTHHTVNILVIKWTQLK